MVKKWESKYDFNRDIIKIKINMFKYKIFKIFKINFFLDSYFKFKILIQLFESLNTEIDFRPKKLWEII